MKTWRLLIIGILLWSCVNQKDQNQSSEQFDYEQYIDQLLQNHDKNKSYTVRKKLTVAGQSESKTLEDHDLETELRKLLKGFHLNKPSLIGLYSSEKSGDTVIYQAMSDDEAVRMVRVAGLEMQGERRSKLLGQEKIEILSVGPKGYLYTTETTKQDGILSSLSLDVTILEQ